MSSSPLYLAIVIVWAIVLVPMLLRRDAADPAAGSLRRTAPRTADDAGDAFDETDDEADPADGPAGDPGDEDPGDDLDDTEEGTRRTTRAAADGLEGPVEDDRHHYREELGHARAEYAAARRPPGRPGAGRARVIARRRRRTSGLGALLIGTLAAVGLDLGPWWVLLPPSGLLLGHLVLLREAAKADSEHRAAERAYRRRRTEYLRRRAAEAEAAAAREAEVIEFVRRREQVYDQYADAHLRAAGD